MIGTFSAKYDLLLFAQPTELSYNSGNKSQLISHQRGHNTVDTDLEFAPFHLEWSVAFPPLSSLDVHRD
jgi:hypothetical protein